MICIPTEIPQELCAIEQQNQELQLLSLCEGASCRKVGPIGARWPYFKYFIHPDYE